MALPEADPLSNILSHPEPAEKALYMVIQVPLIGECSSSVAPPSLAHRFHAGTSSDLAILKLNRFIHYNDPRHVLLIKIVITDTIGTHKEVIKNKPQCSFFHCLEGLHPSQQLFSGQGWA
jgi:hypothetical protein